MPSATGRLTSLRDVTPADALKHPTWVMGPKITVDSATLMNKGLEVLEASWLFDLPLGKIDFVMHRESIIHCLVTLVDGSVKAQLAVPDMHIPIQYALSYPDRLPSRADALDLVKLGKLSFESVDREDSDAPFWHLKQALVAVRIQQYSAGQMKWP